MGKGFRSMVHFLKPEGPYNLFVRFISPNPVTPTVPVSRVPVISKDAFIGPFVSIIGDVTIKEGVFVAPGVSLRADEGTPFYIGDRTNLQDGVILHGLKDEYVTVGGSRYSIYIDSEVTCGHGAIIHGPALLGAGAFVGFHALVFDAELGSGVFVSNHAVVTGGVRVADNRFVPPGAVIDTQQQADRLSPLPLEKQQFAKEVQRVNQAFPSSYSMLFGDRRCSCGLASSSRRVTDSIK
ncbi:carbonate dehydratase [Paenibacillus sp. YIM B09110]|uniref:carbonate dehydratase n=1 Tax=Paenibacillus sp. YIM B09110 TaxID=3126102 RepID=UPI00301DAE08